MEIKDLKSTVVTVPYKEPFVWGWGANIDRTAVIIEISTDSGIKGFGEAVCLHPSAETSRSIVDSSKPFLVNEDPHDIERIRNKLYGIGGWNMHRHTANWVIGGIEMALWDIIGKAAGVPVYKLLGGAIRRKIPITRVIVIKKPKECAADAVKFAEQGYKTLKLKMGIDPERDIETVKAVRDALPDKIKIRVDANEAWSPGTAIKIINKIEKYDIEFAEQPSLMSSLKEAARIRRGINVPLALNESAWGLFEILNIVREEAADILVFCPRMCGGLFEFKKSAAIAEAAGIPVVCHSAIELGIAASAHLHVLASTPNCLFAHDTGANALLADDIIMGGNLKVENGYYTVSDKPGLGIELDEKKVALYAEKYRKEGTAVLAQPVKPDWVPLLPKF